MGNKIVDIGGSIVILAIVTTLILPNRKTPDVINAAGTAFSGAIKSAMGN